MSPALRIDPLGAGPPDTLVYPDRTRTRTATAVCALTRIIGYDVRKWSPAIEQGGVSITAPDWQPYPFSPCLHARPCDRKCRGLRCGKDGHGGTA